MANCPNLQDPDINKQFNEMVSLFGETYAYYLWDLNNGNPLTLDSKGNPSKHYNKFLKETGDHAQSMQAFANLILKAKSEQIFKQQAAQNSNNNDEYSPDANMSEDTFYQSQIAGVQDIDSVEPSDIVPEISDNSYDPNVDIDFEKHISDSIDSMINTINTMSQEDLDKSREKGHKLEDDVPHISEISPIYTGVFFDYKALRKKFLPKFKKQFAHHSTIAFKPSSIMDLPVGNNKTIKIIGRLTTDKVDVLIVENDLSTNKFPHITLSVAEGVMPFASNAEIENNQDKIVPMKESVNGVIGVYDGNRIITKVQKTEAIDTNFSEETAAKLTEKSDLTGESNNLYSNVDLSVSQYENLDLTEYAGMIKYYTSNTLAPAKKMAEKYGGHLFETTHRNGDVLYKVAIKRPISEEGLALVEDLGDEVTSKEVATIVVRKKHRLSALRKKLAEKSPRATEIKASIAILENDINKLEEEYEEPQDLVNVAKDDIRRIYRKLKAVRSNIKDKNMEEAELMETMDSLIDISYAIKGWLNIAELINSDFYENRTDIMSLQGGISESNEIYNQLISDIYLRYANIRSSKTGLTIEDVLAATEDLDKASANFLSIGESNIPLLENADSFMKHIADKINEQSIKKTSELKRLREKAKKALSKTEEQISEMLFQRDKKGEWTGNYVSRTKHSYYEEKQNRANEAKKEGAKGWSKYYKWLNSNTKAIDSHQLLAIESMTKSEIEAMSSEEIANQFGSFSKKAILKQKEFLKDYQSDMEAFAQELFSGEYFGKDSDISIDEDGDVNYTNEDLRKEDEFYRELGIWKENNNPEYYTNSSDKKKGSLNGDKYLITPVPNENWNDPSYDRIMGNTVLKEVYEYMVDTFNENNESLPYFNGLSQNYIPEMTTSFLDKMLKSFGLNKGFSYLKNTLRTAITDEAVSSKDGRIMIGNREIKAIPIGMMQDKIKPEFKEKNIFKIMEAHTNMALNYKYKSQVEPMMMASMDLLESVNEVTSATNEGKKEFRSRYGKTSYAEKKLIQAKDALRFRIDATLYNKTQEVEGMSNKSSEVVDESGNKSNRSYSFSKFVDTLNGITYIKQLGLPNAITPLVNSAFGFISNMTYAAGGVDISEGKMLKANGKMIGIASERIGSKSPEARKVYAFMKRMNVIGDIHDVSTAKKGFTEWMTIMQTKAEFINQGALMWAALDSMEMKDKNGRKTNVFDAFTEKDGELIWNESKMGPQEDVQSSRVLSENKNQVNISSLTAHIDAVNRKVHGDYKNTMKIKENAAMRAVMLYKRWIPQAVVSRFGKEKIDKDLMNEDGTRGRAIKGRYLSYVSATDIEGLEVRKAEIFKILAGALIHKGTVKSNLDKLSEVDKQNLMRNVRELHFIGMLTATMALLKAMFGDDEDGWALKMAINAISKTQADLFFFMSPNSAKQILDNVVPAMSVISDAISVTAATYKTVAGDPVYQNGPWKDQSRVKVATLRAFPITAGGVKMYNYGSRVFQYN